MKKLFTLMAAFAATYGANAQYFEDDFGGAELTSNNAWTTETTNPSFEWELGTIGGQYARMTNYDGGNFEVVSWIVSPAIDLSSATTPTLNFDNTYKFDGDQLQLFISTDYPGGDPDVSGTWTDLSSMVTWNSDPDTWDFTNSGDIDLTAYISSTVYIGFKYTGSDTDGSTWEFDNVVIDEPGAAPGELTIYDIQNTSASPAVSDYLGDEVTTRGVVNGIVLNGPDAGAYFIQDGEGAWNGLYIYDTDAVVAIGDSVVVTGEVDEFNLGSSPEGVTEIKNVVSYTVLNSGNTIPDPVEVTSSEANAEQWEGVLIHVVSGECTDNAEGFGLWSINDGSGVIKGDDDIFAYHLTAVVNDWYSVTGIGHYSFDEAKILPRNALDIVQTGWAGIDEVETGMVAYPNPATDFVQLSINPSNNQVTVYNLNGAVVLQDQNVGQLDVSELASGVYNLVIIQNDKVVKEKLVIR
ncbi:MAG: choice-of-anchor J domain-containing protein [Flavobacteriales bacterium]|nr:choice-of-anchor J domain-containing protein [Flavobacteriales bacterium]